MATVLPLLIKNAPHPCWFRGWANKGCGAFQTLRANRGMRMPRRNANAKARPYIPQAKSLKKRKTRVTHNSECDYSSMEGRRHAPDRHGVCRSCGRRYVPQQTGPTDTLLYRSRA